MINQLAIQAHANAVEKGFYEKEKSIPEHLALIHSEVSEALEADREGNFFNSPQDIWCYIDNDNSLFEEHIKSTFEDELADIIIRVLDLAAWKEIDIEAHIIAKMRYNSTRPHKHGKKY